MEKKCQKTEVSVNYKDIYSTSSAWYKKDVRSFTFNLADFEVLTGPPPSSGAAMLLALNVLEGFNITAKDLNTATYWHRMIEVRTLPNFTFHSFIRDSTIYHFV